MKFLCTVDIALPIDTVVQLFDNRDNMQHWQEGFVSLEHISGQPGQTGAISKLHYRNGKRSMELLETITVKNLPEEMSALYEHSHMSNRMTNRFSALGPQQTRYTAEFELTKVNGFVPRLMSWLMPGVAKKHTQRWLDRFKQFAESHGVADKT